LPITNQKAEITLKHTLSSVTLITAYIAGVPIPCLVTAEATKPFVNPVGLLVAVFLNLRRSSGTAKTVSDHPTALSVITSSASSRRRLGGRARCRSLRGIGRCRSLR